MSSLASLIADGLKSQTELMNAYAALAEAMQPVMADHVLAPVNALGEIMAGLAHPPRIDDLMDADEVQFELLRTFELHGDGLHPFDPKVPASVGDVLVGADRSVWIVSSTDDQGRITGVAGSASSSRERDIILTWRPVSAARAWLQKGQVAAPVYTDLDAALLHLVRLWGFAEFEHRDVTSAPGLFLEVLSAPGMSLTPGDLNMISEDTDLTDFCAERGGLQPFTAETAIAPGDFVRVGQRKIWALVLRAPLAGNGPLDLLAGGFPGAGPVGERPSALRCLRDYSPSPLDTWWRPAKK
jgi:hypothetical protein